MNSDIQYLAFSTLYPGYVDIVELLLSKGANTDGLSHGGTALHVAANNGHDDIVKVLLDHHADVNTTLIFSFFTN